ncbi:MAG TPA: anthrone oxygenase family protein [Thermomicrobiales bacterium]|nr:anthrone oxygenase family protein [Thermomicrobiales bacterium]
MIDEARVILTLVAVLGCGLVGGIFFAFSTFVMKALADQPPSNGIAAMQSINVRVLNGWFLSAFLGTAVVCVVLGIWSLTGLREPEAMLRLAGSLLYLIGCIGVTIGLNVPLNDSLAAVDAGSAEGAANWARYVPDWTAWNTVRTIASLLAAAAFTVAFVID